MLKQFTLCLGALLFLNAPAIAQSSSTTPLARYDAPCHKGYGWNGGAYGSQDGSKDGYASYGGCGDGEYWLGFSCEAGSSTIHLNIEDTFKRARDGQKVRVPFTVGGKRFVLSGLASYSDMLGGAQPQLSFDRSNGLIEALQAGSSASFIMDRKRSRFHLKGTRASFDAMLAACPLD